MREPKYVFTGNPAVADVAREVESDVSPRGRESHIKRMGVLVTNIEKNS